MARATQTTDARTARRRSGSALGGFIGNLLFAYLGLPRAFGWLIMGVSIGAVDGLFDRAWKKVRNGLIGGALGELIGGFLFEPIQRMAASPTGMASRAIAFVLLGVSIGALIGLVQVVLKEAWLTVLDGYRPGRQLILSREMTTLGRAENANLPFFGPTAQEMGKQHATSCQPNGQFVLEDLGAKAGTKVNGEPVQGRRGLRDGDRIQMGGNLIRFSERQRSAAPAPVPVPVPVLHPVPAPAARPVAVTAPVVASPPLPLPPPVSAPSATRQRRMSVPHAAEGAWRTGPPSVYDRWHDVLTAKTVVAPPPLTNRPAMTRPHLGCFVLVLAVSLGSRLAAGPGITPSGMA